MDQRVVDRYYANQAHGFYAGPLVQQGHGLGGLFASLFRTLAPVVKPMLKRGANAVAREALHAGSRIAGDLLEGHGLRDSLQTRSKEAASNLLRKGKRKAQRVFRRSENSRHPKRRRVDILDG
jgi:hypothetical protein